MGWAYLSRSALMAVLLAGSASASDVYVDAVQGSDANGGTSPVDAWQTLTHAVTQLGGGSGADTVHLAAGLYDAALGEAFPILLRDGLTLRGEPGVVLDGDGAAALLRVQPPLSGPSPTVRLEDLALRDGVLGLDVDPGINVSADVTVLRTQFEGFSQAGLSVWAESVGASDLVVRLQLEAVEVRGCGVGVWASAMAVEWEGTDASFELECVDSTFVDNDIGIAAGVEPTGADQGGAVTVMGTRFEGNSLAAVDAGWIPVDLSRCVIVDGGAGLSFVEVSGAAFECTISSNAWGVRSNDPLYATYALKDSIAFDNGDDLLGAGLEVSHCDIGDGDFAGMNGNVSADPLFWAPEFGDYRLGLGSPCIDAGDPSGPLDPDGSIGDMGAFVFDPGYAPAPLAYCEGGLNSLGRRAQISAHGSVSLAANALTLDTASCLPGNSALYVYGGARAEIPLGGGLLCVGPGATGLYRLPPPQSVDASGHVVRTLDFSVPPMGAGPGRVLPGSSWNVQLWYRDGASANLSNALTIWFLP